MKEARIVPLYRYTASKSSREDALEEGTIVALSEEEAKKKLKALQFDSFRLRRINGLRGVIGQLSATIR